MIKKLFILSSKAGKKDFLAFKNQLINVYAKNDRLDEIEIVTTEYKDHAKDAALEFSKKDFENKLVVICGGDGTLGEVADVLSGTDTAISLIPMGTANDFSKNFNYRKFKLEDTFNPSIKDIDIIDVNGIKSINVTSLGFDNTVLKTAYNILEEEPHLGEKAFLKSVFISLKNIKYEDIDAELILENDEKVRFKKAITLLAICNGSYYGSGFNPAPHGKLDDGILNVVTCDKLPLLKLIPLAIRYKFGKHLNSKHIKDYKVKSGKIKSRTDLICNRDGELFETKEINFKVIENGIKWGYF